MTHKLTALKGKWAILLLPLVALALPASALEEDKVKHRKVEFVVGLLAKSFIREEKKALAACLTVGLLKEVHDQIEGSHISGRDLLADAVGCYAGVKLGVVIRPTYIGYTKTWTF